jgi:hypothetical protein
MTLTLDSYERQRDQWPRSGRHILAQFDADSVVVYQAYPRSIGCAAAKAGKFGEGFRLNRMSWVKTSFLWMMYRSGWGTKPGQEVTLAIRVQRSAFDSILEEAVPSVFDPRRYCTEEEWTSALAESSVRVQWDPDRDPLGARLDRRAIQLGLRGEALALYASDWIEGIADISEFVRRQHECVSAGCLDRLVVPLHAEYQVPKPVSWNLGIASDPPGG